MDSMQALVLQTAGAPFRLADLPLPEPTAGQVLVRIHASGVNALDTKIWAGQAAHARHPLPAILGLDMAGVVERVGPALTEFQPGDEVYGMTGGVGGVPGTLAQFAAVDSRLLAPKPTTLSMRALGATPIDLAAEPVDAYVAKYTGGKGFDVVYDTVGGASLDTAFKAVGYTFDRATTRPW